MEFKLQQSAIRDSKREANNRMWKIKAPPADGILKEVEEE